MRVEGERVRVEGGGVIVFLYLNISIVLACSTKKPPVYQMVFKVLASFPGWRKESGMGMKLIKCPMGLDPKITSFPDPYTAFSTCSATNCK